MNLTLATYWDKKEVENWIMNTPSLVGDYTIAVAIRGQVDNIQYLNWNALKNYK